MWFKKNKKETTVSENIEKKDELMSQIIDEVLEEKAAEKEAAMNEPAQTAVPQNKSIAELIEAFIADKNNDTYKAVLDAVFPSTLLIPATPVPENTDEKKKQFAPALVQNPEGEKLLPMFSDKAQIPEEYRKQFSIITMPFGAACELTTKITDCDKIIVNPFTKPFIVNKELIENAVKAIAEFREKKNS